MWFQDFGFVKETSTQLLELDAYLLFQGASLRHDPGGKETQVWSLGQGDPLEKGMATHSSILIWKILWAETSAGL